MTKKNTHSFYGKTIIRRREQAVIQEVLKKYSAHIADENLKNIIHEELSDLKAKGVISIPFKVHLVKAPNKNFKNYVQILLDTKV